MNSLPSPAERARTIARGHAPATLTLPDGSRAEIAAHAADADGRPLLLARTGGPVARALDAWPDADLPSALEIVDIAPVPLPDRVRGRVWMTGWTSGVPAEDRPTALARLIATTDMPGLSATAAPTPAAGEPTASGAAHGEPEWRVLRMDLAEIDLTDLWGTADVDVDDYLAARPDPLAPEEDALMRHLDAAHRRELGTLCARVDALTGACAPRALAVDRYGLWLRVRLDDRPVNARFPFPHPVPDARALQWAYRALLRDSSPVARG